MNNRKLWARAFLAASLLTAALIFFFSAQSGPDSAALSDGITIRVARVVKRDYEQMPPVARQSYLMALSHLIRKNAHFWEFALLGFNLTGYLRFRRWERPLPASMALAWGIALVYAGTDELHQLFTSERGPAIADVGIDGGGALLGVLLMALLMALLARYRRPRAGSSDR